MNIYTAQYKYNGNDRIDITVSGNATPGKVLAPTWEMVKEFKAGKLSQWDYTIKWFSLIVERAHTVGDSWRLELDNIITNRPQITLVCFCPAGEFCHRVLAARMIESTGYGTYKGEWQI